MARKRNWTRHRPLFASPVPKNLRKPKIRLRVLPLLWAVVKRTCIVLGAFMLFSSIIGVISLSMITSHITPPLPDEMVLYIKFEGGFHELPDDISFAEPFAPARLTIREYVDAIDAAAMDSRVKGIYARIAGGSFGLAHIQEIRAALQRFKDSGKFTYMYSSSYGSGGLGHFYLSSLFDEMWIQPLGVVSIAGLRAEMPFFRDVLDKIGVYPQFYKRKEFKTAYESLTNREISKENKQVLEEIVAGIKNEIIKDIPADLGMEEAKFERLINKGLFTALDAKDAGLVTNVDYVDVLIGKIREKITGDPESDKDMFVGINSYYADIENSWNDNDNNSYKPRVALIYAVGAIMDSKIVASISPVFGGTKIAAADEIAPAIIAATKDKSVEAIVLRVDSPGGSPVASESILRALERAREKGKKVIVSMGPMAASGGYWISAYADQIFAMPTTLTGSIGVVGGKFSIGEFWDKIGVNWNGAEWGDNSGIWSLNTPFSSTEEQRINLMLDGVYDAFLERVAKGRSMSVEDVDRIARGHVWFGSAAVKIGLVDQIGGLYDALNYTAELLDVADKSYLEVIVMPKPKTPVEQILEMLGQQGSIYEGLRLQNSITTLFQPILTQISIIKNIGPISAYEPLVIE